MIALNLDILIGFLLDFSVQFGIIISTLFVATKGRRFITQFSSKKSSYQGNRAVAISTIGYYTSIVLIIFSAVQGDSFGYIYDVISIFSIVLLGLIFLTLNRWIVNIFYLKGLNSKYELEKENVAFSIYQIGGFLATAIIFYNSFAGFEFNLGLIYIGTIYFFITQLSLFVTIKIFILQTPYDDIREIKKGNIAVAIEFLSFFIAISMLFGNIAGAVIDIDLNSIATMFAYFTISSIFLIYLPTFLTSILTTGNKKVDNSIEDGNMVVAIKSTVVKITIAIVIIETLPLNIVIS